MDAKNADATFKTFAGTDLPDAKLRQAMIDDVVGMLDYYTWTAPSPDRRRCSPAICRSRATRAWRSCTASPPGTAPARRPRCPAGQRPGLLTRALFLSTGSANTRPIMKGVFLRTNVLCDTIPPPPPGANAKPPELVPGMTTRESVEAITEMPGTICAGCHDTGDQPARVRDRGVRRARALPHGAAAVRRGGRRDRHQAGEHDRRSRRWSTATRRRSRRRRS